MNREELKKRTKEFALRIINLAGALPKTVVGRTFGYQLVKAGTSVRANYRAACRGRSKEEFNSTAYCFRRSRRVMFLVRDNNRSKSTTEK